MPIYWAPTPPDVVVLSLAGDAGEASAGAGPPLTLPHSGRSDIAATTTADAGTYTEKGFAPRRPGGQDHATVVTAVLRSPAIGADVIALTLTPFPVLQVEQDTIQLVARTAAETERQLMGELMWGVQSSYTSGGVPCAYQ